MFKRQEKITIYADDHFWTQVEVERPGSVDPLNLSAFTVTAFAVGNGCKIDLTTRIDDAAKGLASVRLEGFEPGTYALRMDVDDGASNQVVVDADLEVRK
ncbi:MULTISPECIES: hypothetical protein [unclassified Roseovarius]|uniref:hypothetical protein n=1 Tax=unclassified Roseovarius TaxID=2614913 RepID=UPI00273D7CB1|nr:MULTISPECIES: hypothetical protein [unclassified Roseovarius]